MKHEELIEKYIQKRLTAKEELLFDELLKNDVAFKEEVNLHTNLKKVVEKDDDIKFRKLISDTEEQAKEPRQKTSYIKWLAAASVVLLLGVSYFFNMGQKLSTDVLFAQNFEPYRNVIAPIVRGNEQSDEKTLAFMAYEKGEYQTAITLFTKLYTATKEPYYLFYKANALLKLERANEAIPLLVAHLKTKDTLTEKTNWYLALAYLKLKDKQKAREFLNKVITNGLYKNKEAKKLLKEFE
jgi:tetratricopeptide (TPR) repeat protein